MKVFKTPCFGCPFTKDSIVSPERAANIKADCETRDKHFICHKSAHTMQGVPEEVACGGYFQNVYLKTGSGQLLRIMERLGGLEMIDIPAEADAEARRTLKPYRLQRKR